MPLASEQVSVIPRGDRPAFPLEVRAAAARLRAAKATLQLSDREVARHYWSCHPRVRFIKTLPADAALLDLGAGEGGLVVHKEWPEPRRSDLSFYGVGIRFGSGGAPQNSPHTLKYAGWAEVDLDDEMPSFPGIDFNGIAMIHVIEHLKAPQELLRWIVENAAPGAKLYIEWPSPHTVRLPSRRHFKAEGIDVLASNFSDDPTHREPLTTSQIQVWLKEAGFRVISSGEIDAGILGEELVARGIGAGDAELLTMGYWSMSRWASFIIAEIAPW